MDLRYGKRELQINREEFCASANILLPRERAGLAAPLEAVKESLLNPIKSPALSELITQKRPRQVVIIVNDISRVTPYNYLLPPLLEELHQAGVKEEEISFVIATGIHSPHSEEQNKEVFGEEFLERYKFVSHNPDRDLVNLGQLSSGNILEINQQVMEADFLIATGVITPHYFAGFSGGRKSILPGVAGRKSIQYNHSQMVELLGDLPSIEENPLSQEMFEAAHKVGVDFILNVVTNSQKEIVEVVAGDCKAAWYKGVQTSAEMYHVPLAEKVDLAIVSAGGYPKDLNMYQAQKALDNANYGVKEGGTIILLAECEGGWGEDVFEEWLASCQGPEHNIRRIEEEFVIGGHKAFAISKVVLDKEFILISSFDQKETERLFAKKFDSLDKALLYADNKYDGDYTSIIMPQGGLTVPIVRESN